ncbi:MAG: hypothetical protein ACREFB_09605 [Stellaceae bacterium]
MMSISTSPGSAVSPLGAPGGVAGVLRRVLIWVAARTASAVEQRDNRLPPEYFRFPLF